MDLLSVTPDQVDALHNLKFDGERIKEHAKKFIARLSAVCQEETVRERWGVSFMVQPDGTTVELETPFGDAKAQLSLLVNGESVEGVWGVRRKGFNEEGEPVFLRVASFRVSKSGTIYLGETDERPISSRTQFVAGEDLSAYQVMGAIIYLLGAH
ncbi:MULTISPECIES: hypothetical protein [Pseudomonas]|uniref:hypothetical protein n=1 Tax=Pseudomonas TaxID=286 RepID=UPI0008121282|nr:MULTISPECIES: hypothetical protein [unclassified Pseudomonas]MCM2362459.1 hypothetical protein [Pseudomonas sp. SR18]CRM87331.1 hypothetical protein [Pseudomonas sp. 22 E 5]